MNTLAPQMHVKGWFATKNNSGVGTHVPPLKMWENATVDIQE